MEEKIEFFQALDPQNKCGKLSEEYKLSLELENVSLSAYSPGAVSPSEDIGRMVFSPLHIDEDGTIKAAAFEDVRDKGLSVQPVLQQKRNGEAASRGFRQNYFHRQCGKQKDRRRR